MSRVSNAGMYCIFYFDLFLAFFCKRVSHKLWQPSKHKLNKHKLPHPNPSQL
jgi:hypothetical protein